MDDGPLLHHKLIVSLLCLRPDELTRASMTQELIPARSGSNYAAKSTPPQKKTPSKYRDKDFPNFKEELCTMHDPIRQKPRLGT